MVHIDLPESEGTETKTNKKLHRSDHIAHSLYFLLIAVGLIPILSVSYVPLVDIPNHLLASGLYFDVGGYAAQSDLTAEWLPSPYILAYTVMSVASRFFGHLVVAKLICSLYLVLLPISILILFRTFNPGNWFLAFPAFVMMYTRHFEFGFIPYCLGIPFVILSLVVLKRLLENERPRLVFLAGIILLCLVYLSHLDNAIAICIGGILMGTLTALSTKSGKSALQRWRTMIFRLSIIAAPATLLAIVYLSSLSVSYNSAESPLTSVTYGSFVEQVMGPVWFLFSGYMVLDIIVIIAVGSLVLALFLSRSYKLTAGFTLYFALVMFLLTLVIPRQEFLGSWDHNSRFAIFGFVALLSSFKAVRGRSSWVVPSVVALLFVISTAYRVSQYSHESQTIQDYVEEVLTNIPEGQKVYSVYAKSTGRVRGSLPKLMHAIAYYHLDKGGSGPFLFTDQPHIAGVWSDSQLPSDAMNVNWNPIDAKRMSHVLSFYDYCVVAIDGAEVPKFFESYDDCKVHQSSVCVIYDLGSCSKSFPVK